MEQTRFDGFTRQLARLGTRRTALSVAAASGLAATGLGLEAATSEAKKNVSAEKKRRRRGKRGKRGGQGPQGPQGPPVGADAVVITETCTLEAPGGNPGDTRGCTASCENGFAAVGGGFAVDDVLGSLGVVRSSFPETDGNKPIGWTAEIEFINIGQDFDITVYAVCVPA